MAGKLSFSYTEEENRNSIQVGFEVVVLFLLQETSATIRYRSLSFRNTVVVLIGAVKCSSSCLFGLAYACS